MAVPEQTPAEPLVTSPPADLTPDLLAALTSRATILTANQRGAHSIRQAYNRAMRQAGLRRWQPADVLPLETWLSTCWHRLLVTGAADRLLLNSTQERALWRTVITADEGLPTDRRQTASADTLAGLAADAWRLLLLARGRDRLSECASTTEGQAFTRWVEAFERALNANPDAAPNAASSPAPARMLTAAQLPGALEATLRIAGPAMLGPDALGIGPTGLTLVDFDILPAAHIQLLDALRAAGCRVEPLRTTQPAVPTQLYRAPDDAAELTSCATWVRRLRQRAPAVRIAIIVPQLAERRPALERVFATTLGTAPFDPAPPFEFSLGRPLAETALAATALSLLRWVFEPLPLTAISGLLRAPYLSQDAASSQAAAEFDAFELRQRDALRQSDALRPEFPLPAMIAALEHSPRRARLANLLYRLRQLRETAAELSLNLTVPITHAAAASAFRALLDAAGCAPSSNATAAEHQLWHAWESLLDELATLDATARATTTAEAVLAELTRLAGARLFAPESQDAPIQIAGPLELACIHFDALWFMGADDLAWPPTTAASPLQPWRLQNALGLPGADRTRDRELYAEITARLAASATETVFSFAATAVDGDRRISPLLAALTLTEYTPSATEPAAAAPLEHTFIPDDSTLPPPFFETGLRGGAQIFQLQAACAFRAFAELRAFSTGLETRETGLNALERGTLVHRTMEVFWQRVADQQILRAFTADERHATLDACITEALTRATAAAVHTWDHAYLEIQRKRLHQLLAPWLDIEAARPPFAVLQQETSLDLVEIGGLRIRSLRVDRIDETSGGLLILDYKTGAAHPKGWLGERPEQPQLPLYAAIFSAAADAVPPGPAQPFRGELLAGVAFASLRPGKSLGLNGFSDDARVLPASATMDQPTFAEQVADWRRILTTLAEAFATGDAQVKPLNYPETCRHCGQRILCRLNPATLPEPNEEDDLLNRQGSGQGSDQSELEATLD